MLPMLPNNFSQIAERIQRQNNRSLKDLFKNDIRGSFLINIKYRVFNVIGEKCLTLYDFRWSDERMVTGNGPAPEYDICKHIVGVHKANTIFLTADEKSKIEKDENYKTKLTKQVAEQIFLRGYRYSKKPRQNFPWLFLTKGPVTLFQLMLRRHSQTLDKKAKECYNKLAFDDLLVDFQAKTFPSHIETRFSMDSMISVISQVALFFQSYGGLITWLLLALPFLLLLLILMPVFMVKGFKKGTFHGLVSLGCSLLAFLISIPLAKLCASLIASLVFGGLTASLEDLIASAVPSLSGILSSATYLSAYFEGVFSAVIATVLFVLFAFILLILLKNLICKLLKKYLTKENPGGLFKTGGLLIRGVDALLVSFLFLVPLYCLLGSAAALGENTADAVNGAAQVQTVQTEGEEDISLFASALNTVCSPVSDSPLVKASLLPGFNFPQRVFCSFRCDGRAYNLYDVLYDGSDLILGGVSLLEKKPAQYSDEEVALLKDLIRTAEENDFFYGLFLDGVRFSDRFLLEALPEENQASTLITTLIDPFKSCTVDDVKESASALVDIFESAVSHGVLSGLEEDGDLFGQVAKGSFIDDTVTALRSNSTLSSVADNLLIAMMDVMSDIFDTAEDSALADTFHDLKKTIEENVNKGQLSVDEEISSLKQIAAGLSALSSAPSTEGIEAINTEGISKLLIGLGRHPHVGADAVGTLLRDLLPSFVSSNEASILTDDFINSAVDALVYDVTHPASDSKKGKFENLLLTAKNLTVIVSTGTGASSDPDRTDLRDTIDSLLTDMSKESAEIIQNAISKDVMDAINKNGQTGGNTEGFVKDLIGNMAEFEGETEGDIVREREAVMRMNDLLLDADNKLQNKPDDGTTALETAVGGDLKGFVTEVSSSVVLMQTVSGSFERSPDKVSDPDGFFGNMNDEDRARLSTVCSELLGDETLSAEQKANVKILCAYMGGSLN